jgi:transposase
MGHDVWSVLAIVDELDVSEFERAYRLDGQGRPPFSPKMMLALLVYCYGKGVRSGRAIAAACLDDLGCRVITGNKFPGRSTIDDFLGRHAVALRGLLPQTIGLGHGEGLVDVSLVAGDGTTIKANASKAALAGQDRLNRQITDLEQRVGEHLQEWEQAMLAAPHADDGTDSTTMGGGARPSLAQADHQPSVTQHRVRADRQLLDARRTALTRLQEQPSKEWQEWSARDRMARRELREAEQRLASWLTRQQDLLERYEQARATGGPWRGNPPMPLEQHYRINRARASVASWTDRAARVAAQRPSLGKVNATDPDAALMPGKRGGFAPHYNVQAVCCRNQFVLSIAVHPSSNDKQAMIPALESARANLNTAGITDPIGTALFDSGYASEANFTQPIPVTALLVSVGKERQQAGRDPNPDPTRQKWAAMAGQLADPDNAELYKKRSAIIEPLFAQLFACYGRELAHRGIDDVTTEIHLWAVAHNLRKIIRRRAKPATVP